MTLIEYHSFSVYNFYTSVLEYKLNYSEPYLVRKDFLYQWVVFLMSSPFFVLMFNITSQTKSIGGTLT